MKGRCSLGLKSTSLSPAVTLLKNENKGRPFMTRKERAGQAASPAEGLRWAWTVCKRMAWVSLPKVHR